MLSRGMADGFGSSWAAPSGYFLDGLALDSGEVHGVVGCGWNGQGIGGSDHCSRLTRALNDETAVLEWQGARTVALAREYQASRERKNFGCADRYSGQLPRGSLTR